MRIRTDRLVLRPFEAGDVADVLAYQRLPEVARHLLWAARDLRAAERSVRQMMTETALAEDGDCLAFAMVVPDLGRVIGQVELVQLSREHRQGEVGYVVHPGFHGRGLATEATAALLRLGFDELDLHRIVGRCSAHNSASAGLMERLGMRREAHFVGNLLVAGTWREEYVYAMLQHEWRAGGRDRTAATSS